MSAAVLVAEGLDVCGGELHEVSAILFALQTLGEAALAAGGDDADDTVRRLAVMARDALLNAIEAVYGFRDQLRAAAEVQS